MMKYRLHEITQFRNKHQVFADRHDAGQVLANLLAPEYAGIENGIILSIPSGGVPIGQVIARRLLLPHELIIVRKLQIPGDTEAGFGAMKPDGGLLLNKRILRSLHLSQEQIDEQAAKVRRELARRNFLFRQERPFPSLTGKTVILVDDGLASGYTMLAAAQAALDHHCGRLVVAVPTSLLDSLERVAPLADEIYCANVLDYWPFAVANAYRNWYDLSEDEVVKLLHADKAPAHAD